MDNFFSKFLGQAGDIAGTLLEKGYYKFDKPIDSLFCEDILGDRLALTAKSSYVSGATEVNALLDALGTETFAKQIAEHLEERLGVELVTGSNHHVLRSVQPGDVSEAFRGHFDSHALTILLPIQIPLGSPRARGELFLSSHTRRWPKSEIENVIGKIIWKIKMAIFNFQPDVKGLPRVEEFSFDDGCPVMFLGKICLHGNYPLKFTATGFRHTVLAHFYDDSGPLSVSELTRKLRRRGA